MVAQKNLPYFVHYATKKIFTFGLDNPVKMEYNIR